MSLPLPSPPDRMFALSQQRERPPAQLHQQAPLPAPMQAPPTAQPPLVFGKFDDAMSDDDKIGDKTVGDVDDGIDDEEDYPHAFLCPITHVRLRPVAL